MSLGWVVAGTVFQFMLGFMGFMGAVFGGGAAANNYRLTPLHSQILDWSLYVLPGLCVLSGSIVVVLYLAGAGGWSFLWHLLPVAALVLYGWYVFGYLAR